MKSVRSSTPSMAARTSSRIVRYCAFRSTNGTRDASAMDGSQSRRRGDPGLRGRQLHGRGGAPRLDGAGGRVRERDDVDAGLAGRARGRAGLAALEEVPALVLQRLGGQHARADDVAVPDVERVLAPRLDRAVARAHGKAVSA